MSKPIHFSMRRHAVISSVLLFGLLGECHASLNKWLRPVHPTSLLQAVYSTGSTDGGNEYLAISTGSYTFKLYAEESRLVLLVHVQIRNDTDQLQKISPRLFYVRD